MILTPLDQRDPRLRQTCAPVPRASLRDRQQQLEIDALLDFVHGVVNKNTLEARRDPGRPTTVGLAANQVGILKQLCVVDLSIGRQGYTDFYVLVNPKITWRSKAQLVKPEGCVNFQNVWGATVRARTVKIEACDRSGNDLTIKLTGWPAILAQHEIDHLQGRLFIDRLEDPAHAHLVPLEDYARYRNARGKWSNFVDVRDQAVPITSE